MMIMRHIAHAFGRRRPELAASRDMTQRTLNWNTNARVVRDGKSMAKANGLITICAALHLSPASPHSWTTFALLLRSRWLRAFGTLLRRLLYTLGGPSISVMYRGS